MSQGGRWTRNTPWSYLVVDGTSPPCAQAQAQAGGASACAQAERAYGGCAPLPPRLSRRVQSPAAARAAQAAAAQARGRPRGAAQRRRAGRGAAPQGTPPCGPACKPREPPAKDNSDPTGSSSVHGERKSARQSTLYRRKSRAPSPSSPVRAALQHDSPACVAPGGQAQGKVQGKAKEKPKTREELDAELDAWKMKDSKVRRRLHTRSAWRRVHTRGACTLASHRAPVHADGRCGAVGRLGRVHEG